MSFYVTGQGGILVLSGNYGLEKTLAEDLERASREAQERWLAEPDLDEEGE